MLPSAGDDLEWPLSELFPSVYTRSNTVDDTSMRKRAGFLATNFVISFSPGNKFSCFPVFVTFETRPLLTFAKFEIKTHEGRERETKNVFVAAIRSRNHF